MVVSKHCKLRQKQRHISDTMLNLALMYGKEIKNTDKVALKKSDIDDLCSTLFDLIKQLER